METKAGACVAIYVRISVDRAGRREGVGRQEKWGRAYAARVWPGVPVRVFADNDASAFDEDSVRPGYDALLDAIRRREVLHLWSVEQTRIEANNRRWVGLVADLDDAGLDEIHTERDGVVRLDEVADIKQALSHHERKRARKRLRDTLNDLADEGRPHGGNTFGYRPAVDADGRKTMRSPPAEVFALRWWAGAVLAGWSVTNIGRQMNQFNALRWMFGHRGVEPIMAWRIRRDGSVVSPLWVPPKIRGALTNPTVAGFRVHHGEVHRRGTWEPILDEVTWRRVCAALSAPRKVTRRDGKTMTISPTIRPARKFQLTGYVYCGREECGHHMTGRTQRDRGRQEPRIYFCVRDPDAGGGCNGTGIVAPPLEADFKRRLFDRLRSKQFRAALASDGTLARREEIAAEMSAVEQRNVALARRWATPGSGLSDEAWDVARQGLADQLSALSAELVALPPPLVDIDPEAIMAVWDHLAMEEQRHVIARVVDRIVIGPAVPGASWYERSRVTVVWR